MAAHVSDAGGTGDPTETMEIDWSHSQQASRQHCTTSLNLESRGEREKRTTEKHVASRPGSRRQRNWVRDSCRDCLRTGVPGGVMLAVYAPEVATKDLIAQK